MISEKNNLNFRVDLLNDAPMSILVAQGRHLVIAFVNKCAAALLESKTQQPLGMSVRDLLPEVLSQPVLEDIHTTCFTDGKTISLREQQIVPPVDGKNSLGWFDITVKPIPGDTHITDNVIFYFTDVTANVQSRRAIALNEDYLANFFRQAPVALVLYRGEDFIVDLANEKALEIWGKSIEEIRGKPIIEIFPEVESDPIIKARHAESLARLKRGDTHVVNEVELTFVRNGLPHTGWYNYIHEPYKDVSGRIIGMMAIAIDITEQVVARKKLELITNALPSLVSYINSREEYEFVNDTYENWFAKSKKDVIGKSIVEVLGTNAYAKVKQHVDKVLSGKRDSFEAWIDYQGGTKRFISATYVPHFDESKRVLGYFGLVNDLTDLKQNQEALQDHEARLDLLTRTVEAGTFEYDLISGAIHWSDQLKFLLGISQDQTIRSEDAWSVVHPDDVDLIKQGTSKITDAASEIVSIDYRIIRKDNGVTRWMHSRFKVIAEVKDGSSRPCRMIGFTIDITDRKMIEQQLKEFNHQLESEVQQRTAELSKANRLLTEKNLELSRTQSFLQQLIDSSVEIIAVVDTELKYIAINSTFENKLRLSATDVLGKTVEEVFPAAKNSEQLNNIKTALKGEMVRANTYQAVVDPNIFVDSHYVPLRQGENVVGVIMMVRDVSDVVRNERKLENVNRQLEDAQQLAKLGSWEWDVSSGNIVWSDEMYRIYGYNEKFPVDFVRATERMAPEDAERSRGRTHQFIQEATQEFKMTGKLFYETPAIEYSIALPDGSKKMLRSSGKIQLREDGKLHRVLGAVQDVTQIRSVEEKLRELVSELELKNQDLESFNFVASHDLQEPLRKIQTFIGRIKSDGTTEEVKADYLNRIDNAAKRMGGLIQSMLTLASVSKHEGQFTEVDLNSIVEHCKSEFELVIREKGATIQSENLPVIRASEFQIQQLFNNLISNAFKFSKENPLIKISCERVKRSNRDYWHLTFTDNGIGFDPQYKEQIFELFQRLHSKNQFSGTGIGLSIVKRIVERHNGFIEASSAPGEGATFSIHLPTI